MKITLFVLFLLCTAAAFGQTGAAVLSNQPQILMLPGHPLHADFTALAAEGFLVGGERARAVCARADNLRSPPRRSSPLGVWPPVSRACPSRRCGPRQPQGEGGRQ